jgi:hypothetical protein
MVYLGTGEISKLGTAVNAEIIPRFSWFSTLWTVLRDTFRAGLQNSLVVDWALIRGWGEE